MASFQGFLGSRKVGVEVLGYMGPLLGLWGAGLGFRVEGAAFWYKLIEIERGTP